MAALVLIFKKFFDTITPMFRRFLSLLFVSSLLFPLPAHADSFKSVKYRIDGIERGLRQVTYEYEKVYSKYEIALYRYRKAEKEFNQASKERRYWQSQLAKHTRFLYKQGTPNFLPVLLQAEDFSLLLVQWRYLQRVSETDGRFFKKVAEAEVKWLKKRENYQKNKKYYQKYLASLNRKKNELMRRLNREKSLLASLRQSYLARRVRSYRGGVAAVNVRIGSFVFPVAGPHSYIDSFGAPRTGHRHQGTDIFAPYGTPVVACVSGTVRVSYSRLGGKSIWLSGSDGNSYYYAHLSGFATSSGAQVAAGQVIGYVGNSGNARGGAPHLHFEIHPGGGRAINPYPILRAAD